MAVVSGKSVFARVHKPGKYGTYHVKLAVDKETAKELKKEGVRITPASEQELKDGSTAEQWGEFIAHFKEEQKPNVVGPDGKTPIADLIGNGSDINIQYRVGTWTFSGKTGKTAYLKGVQVVALVPYQPEGPVNEFGAVEGNEFDDESEF